MGPQIGDAQMVAFCCLLSKEMVDELCGLKRLMLWDTLTCQYAVMVCTQATLSLLLIGYSFRFGRSGILSHEKRKAQYYCLELLLHNMFHPRQLNIIVQYFILLLGQDE